MKISPRSRITLLAGLLLAGGAAMVGLKRNEIQRQRAAHEALTRDSAEADRLAQENRGAGELRPDNAELEKLRAENQDLPRLRNEVTQLRNQAAELKKLHAEHERLQSDAKAIAIEDQQAASAPPPGYVSKADLRDLGLGSPEAALQTYFRAMVDGNLDRMSQCEVDGAAGRNASAEYERQSLANRMNRFAGFVIVAKQELSPDEVTLDIRSNAGGVTMGKQLKRIGGEWKVEEGY